MTKLTPEEQEAQLTDFAYAAARYLKDVGCVREADNIEPVWASTDDICEAIGASRSLWVSVRQKMLELDIPLALAYYGGYYIGFPGDQYSLLAHKKSMIRGIANSYREDITTIARNGGTLDEVKKRGDLMLRGNFEVNDVPKMLRALGCPLHPQIEIALIESGAE